MKKIPHKIKRILKILGPGFITGASDDDPAGIVTFLEAGARFGYRQLWTTLFTFPFMNVIQEMCGRIGMVTGKGLSGVIRKYYAKYLLYGAVFLLVIANVINIGADLGAMASSAQLIIKLPFVFFIITITALILFLEIFVSYRNYVKYLKYMALALLAYVATAFIVKQDWRQVALSTIIPYFSLDKSYLLNFMAILGTSISPYLFFWQASEEVEEEVKNHKIRTMNEGKPKIDKRDLRYLKQDTIIGMLFSNFIVFFICLTAASTLGKFGITDIKTASQAAEVLRPLAGNLTFFIFTIGIIGSGLLAVPILAGSASYALSEIFGWKEGLYRKFKVAHGFYGVIAAATLIGLLINLTPIKPFQMLIYSAAINGILAPPLLVIIILIANNKKIMGKYTNSKASNIMNWLITIVMTVAAIFLIYSLGHQ